MFALAIISVTGLYYKFISHRSKNLSSEKNIKRVAFLTLTCSHYLDSQKLTQKIDLKRSKLELNEEKMFNA